MIKEQRTFKRTKDNRSQGRFHAAYIEWLFPISIFLLASLLYSNTLSNGFVMDDGAVITDNVTVQKGLAGIRELFNQSSVYGSTKDNYGSYRPLTMTFFALEWELFGRNSSRYHLVHILLYAICCMAVFLTLKSLLKDYHPLLPVISMLLFAAHPVHSEIAANIKSADEILSLLFCSASLWFYLKYHDYSKISYLVAGAFFFLAALFSKESSITYLAVIPLALLLFTRFQTKKIVLLSALNLAAIALLLAARNSVLEDMPATMVVVNNLLVGASNFSEKFGTIFIFLLDYLRLLIFPHPLTWDYGYNHIPLTSFKNPLALLSLAIHLLLGIFSLSALIKQIRTNDASAEARLRNLLAFLALFYIATMSVYTNIFVLLAATMAERFLFIPSLAFCIAAAIGLLKISGHDIVSQHKGNLIILSTLTVAMLIPYSLKTWTRNKDWKSNYTLFEAGTKTSPNSYRANMTFGWENLLAGEKATDANKKSEYFKKSSAHYRKALSIYDKSGDDWFNYGVTQGYLKNEDEAVKAYNRAVKTNNNGKANYNLGAICLQKGDYSQALNYFLAAYKRDANIGNGPFYIGLCYHYLNKPAEAIPYYEIAYRKNPSHKDVVNNLMIAYRVVGNKEKESFYQDKLKNLK